MELSLPFVLTQQWAHTHSIHSPGISLYIQKRRAAFYLRGEMHIVEVSQTHLYVNDFLVCEQTAGCACLYKTLQCHMRSHLWMKHHPPSRCVKPMKKNDEQWEHKSVN